MNLLSNLSRVESLYIVTYNRTILEKAKSMNFTYIFNSNFEEAVKEIINFEAKDWFKLIHLILLFIMYHGFWTVPRPLSTNLSKPPSSVITTFLYPFLRRMLMAILALPPVLQYTWTVLPLGTWSKLFWSSDRATRRDPSMNPCAHSGGFLTSKNTWSIFEF